MVAPGMEAGIHVFFALLSGLLGAATLALLVKKAGDLSTIRILSLLIAIFVWLSWVTVIPVYTTEYGTDKAVIKSFDDTRAAHSLGMETKEHIFYTGLILSALLPITAYSVNPAGEAGRRLLISILIILLLGFLLMDALGAWIGLAAKQAWMMRAGG
ncbi:hypothetical protein [Archaeoglobus neptunius]|uniref:hypothetical protein n=1 Tax=Archaeoglobus neptunius TaxID=2798580 RepID=UPI0019286DA2|nr:hypothetical protein [Archaeoglobus neptunius]